MPVVIDTRGLSCPQPVLMFHNSLKTNDGEDFEVMVDNEASRENVSRAARNKGFAVDAIDEPDGVVRLLIRKPD